MKKGMTLRDILNKIYFESLTMSEAEVAIIEIFKGCVPKESTSLATANFQPYESDEDKYWNECRALTLENIERLR